jgi:hypothetical protein
MSGAGVGLDGSIGGQIIDDWRPAHRHGKV